MTNAKWRKDFLIAIMDECGIETNEKNVKKAMKETKGMDYYQMKDYFLN